LGISTGYLSMLFKAYTGASIVRYVNAARVEKLRELLGMDTFIACDPNVTVVETVETDEMRRLHFTMETEPGYFTHCHLCTPRTFAGKLPLCLCLQGHSTGAHISYGEPIFPKDEKSIRNGDRDFAVRAVKEGYAALCLEQRCFGACGGHEGGDERGCKLAAHTALLLGRTIIGERVWDISRVVDVVMDRFADIITMENSILMGNSGGGTATYYAACLEHRFSLYMPSCAVCTFRDSIIAMIHCACNYVPGVLNYFDMGDMAAMIAPSKLLVVCGKEDPIFPLHGVEESFELIRMHYEAAGVPDFCGLVIGDEAHRFYADPAWEAAKKLLAL
ncbi:MAG: hypothetical protein J6S76_04620, partial [Clostridia bacterium]|nr:hypothetical protein [Clostridia bacterium]